MEQSSPKVPPHSLEAEAAVLGGILLDNTALDRVAEVVTAEDFYREAHRKIFRAATELSQRSEPIDLLTLTEALKTRGELSEIGGAGYVSELTDRALSAANIQYHARIVREKAILRGLISTAAEIVARGYEAREDVTRFVDEAEQAIYQIAEKKTRASFTRVGDMITETFRQIEQLYERKEMVTGVPTGFTDLDRMTAGLQPSDLIIVAGRPSMGKCVAADTEIVSSDGTVATIEEVCRRQSAEVLTLGDDWKLRPVRPAAYVDDGVKPVFRVTTRLGRSIKTTLTHPFMTVFGWKPLSEIRVGEHVAVPRILEVFGSASIGAHRAKLLGYLLGDGGLTGTCPNFTNSNPAIRADFEGAVREFGGLKVCAEDSHGTRTTTLRVSSDRLRRLDSRREFGRRLRGLLRRNGWPARRLAATLSVSPASVTHWCQGATAPSAAIIDRIAVAFNVSEEISAIRESEANGLTQWLRDLGLWRKRAAEKFVPPVVFALPREELALFLNRLFATDGWATVLSSGQVQLGFASTSKRLAHQLQHLLLRFGVIASLRPRRIKYRGSERSAFQLDITDARSIERFVGDIGIFGKEPVLARVRQALRKLRYQTNRDLIPRGIWQQVDRARAGRSWKWVGERLGLRSVGLNLHVGKRGLSRSRLQRLADALEDANLRRIATSDVYWDEVVSIEAVGAERVFDLTIPHCHNFVANDVCVHNTSFCLNIAEHVAIEKGIGVAVFSLEMSKEQLVLRMLCSQARVDLSKVRTGFLAQKDFPRLAEAAGRIHDAPIYVDDTPALSALEVRAKSRRLKRTKEANLGLIIVDYLQLMRGSSGRDDSREQEISQISGSLKALAKELRVPVIALSQLNRQVESRQPPKPRMADLRESGAIEQDADVIAFIYRDEVYNPQSSESKGKAEIIIAKQRNGPIGDVELTFLHEYTRFENREAVFSDETADGRL